MPRLVIPAGSVATAQAYAHRPETWQQLADAAGVELAWLGDQWCIDNHVDGLGIAPDYVPPPDPVPPPPQLADVLATALTSISAPMSAPDMAAVLAEAVAPFAAGTP